jgi:hypothetical protein
MRIDETPRASQMEGAIKDALEVLDLNQEVIFQAYTRVVLPLDGYVFWQPTVKIKRKGSLHYSQEIQQEETETVGFATVVFTSEGPVTEFAEQPINSLFVACAGGHRFAFNSQGDFYQQARLFHYFGHSVYPALSTQLLDDPRRLPDPTQAIVSNSLPLWLALAGYTPPYYDGLSNKLLLYPSFLVQPNLIPPYITVHIPPEGTRALQPLTWLDANSDSYQLAADRVRLTLYGLQNNHAIDFLNCVQQYSRDTENFGVMNISPILDGIRTQPELQARGMQKMIDVEISYYQTRVNEIARQMIIKAAVASYEFVNP